MSIKRKIVILFIFLISFFNVKSQKGIDKDLMKKDIILLDTTRDKLVLQKLSVAFDKRAAASKKEWYASYYAALAYVKLAFEEQGKMIDVYCDKAEKHLNAILKIKKEDDELMVLRSMITSSRIMADPLTRGQTNAALASQMLDKAKELNPENPRIYLQRAIWIYFTPEIFGGGKLKALPVFKTAAEKYAKFKPKGELDPNWGLNILKFFLNEISKSSNQ
jgi:hypothetical protein